MESFSPLRYATPEVPGAPRAPARLAGWMRVVMVLGGLTLLVLLATARVLEPSARGFGTHRQLGLPDCTFIQLFGERCPACGMTTSWAYLTRGDVLSALSVNAGGTLLGLIALVSGPWLLGSGVKGRWLGQPHEVVIITIGIAVCLVIFVDWGLRLYFA